MDLVINGEEQTFSPQRVGSVAQLMEAMEIEKARGVAVAVNDEVVPRGEWERAELGDGDRVEVIRATQGG